MIRAPSIVFPFEIQIKTKAFSYISNEKMNTTSEFVLSQMNLLLSYETV